MATLHELSQEVDAQIRSDKSSAYLDFYEQLLAPMRDANLNIMEVGVFHGGGLLMLARFFPNARLLGVDINMPPALFFERLQEWGLSERVKVMQGSQNDPRFVSAAIQGFFGSSAQLDIVIDDASHMYRRTRATFDHVFYNHLKPGGHFFIEDWGCGYWPKWPDGNPNGRHGLPRLIKELVDLVALEDRTRLWKGRRAIRGMEDTPSPIERMIIVPSVTAIIKAKAR